MRAGTVVGRVWSTKKLEQLPAGALLEIEVGPNGDRLIAFDPLGCGENEQVLIVCGTAARDHFAGKGALVDALVIASLDSAGPTDEQTPQ